MLPVRRNSVRIGISRPRGLAVRACREVVGDDPCGMRIVRFRDDNGVVGLGAQHAAGAVTRLVGSMFERLEDTGEPVRVEALLAPLVPAAVLCIGRNYAAHAAEQSAAIPDRPVLFMKMPSAVQGPDAPIVIPRHLGSEQVDYEGELAVVIGRECINASRSDALDYVLGYCCANDVSARDWQKQWGGGQWCRGKTFATFCPLGPVLVTRDELPDPRGLRLQTRVNGEVRQDARTDAMMFDVPELIEFLSGSTVLAPGTVILTGTPAGVGFAMSPPRFLQPGDIVEVEVEGIGTLRNAVVAEAV